MWQKLWCRNFLTKKCEEKIKEKSNKKLEEKSLQKMWQTNSDKKNVGKITETNCNKKVVIKNKLVTKIRFVTKNVKNVTGKMWALLKNYEHCY